jgi:hypothetical protein
VRIPQRRDEEAHRPRTQAQEAEEKRPQPIVPAKGRFARCQQSPLRSDRNVHLNAVVVTAPNGRWTAEALQPTGSAKRSRTISSATLWGADIDFPLANREVHFYLRPMHLTPRSESTHLGG